MSDVIAPTRWGDNGVWLQVSYSGVFNWAHRLRGHVFQGRYTAVLIQPEAGLPEVARYRHPNPVRTQGLGLGKAEQRRARVGNLDDPGAELVRRRLEVLEDHRCSSRRVYGGREPAPEWLETGFISRLCGARNRPERLTALGQSTEAPVRQGRVGRPWDRLIGGLVLGDADYARAVIGRGATGNAGGERVRRCQGCPGWSGHG